MEVVPLFTSEYSVGESILTIRPSDKNKSGGPKSIIELALKHNLKKVVLIENTMAGFLSALNNFSSAGVQLVFGLKLAICASAKQKDDPSRETESKVILLLKNSDGYKNLVKIWNRAAIDNFYYYPRLDWALLKEFWDDNHFILMFPFYSSFIARNILTLNRCVPDFSFTRPIFTCENSRLPFDFLLERGASDFCSQNGLPIIKTRSIYYETFDDFKAFQTFRCIQKKSTLEKPNLEHFASNAFCLEEFINQINENAVKN